MGVLATPEHPAPLLSHNLTTSNLGPLLLCSSWRVDTAKVKLSSHFYYRKAFRKEERNKERLAKPLKRRFTEYLEEQNKRTYASLRFFFKLSFVFVLRKALSRPAGLRPCCTFPYHQPLVHQTGSS